MKQYPIGVGAQETWASGEAYEEYIGRWSRLVAAEFLRHLDPDPQGRWLEVGCGTGALTTAILDVANPSSVRGEDPSEAHVAHASAHVTDERAEFSVGNALSIAAPDRSYDYVVSGLVINFVPDPRAGVTEMRRVTEPGGTVAAYVWDYSDGMEMIRYFWEVASRSDPKAAQLDEGVRFPVCSPGPLAALWDSAGLREVDVDALVVPTVFESFDDYWSPFLGGQGPAPGYAMSLSEASREGLREALRQRLPADETGQIELHARAWAVRGTA